MNPPIFEWLLFAFLFRKSAGLYEDQIGKFEWRQQYIGKLKYSHFDVVSPIKKVIVATEKNVLAALSLKTGEILWRQILESEENGRIRLLFAEKEILTVSGKDSPLVRGWELERGYLLWEWGVTPHDQFTRWMSIKEKLVQIDFHPSSHFTLTLYHVSTGRKIKSQIIPAVWLIPEQCVVQNDVIACVSGEKLLYSIKIVEEGDNIGIKIHHRSLFDLFKEEPTGGLKMTAGKLPLVSMSVGKIERAILLQPEIQAIQMTDEKSKVFGSALLDQDNLAIISFALENETLHVTTRTKEGEVIPELSNKLHYADTHGDPEFALTFCQPRKDRGFACRLLIGTTHDVIQLIQHPGKILWTREESLSSILTVEMVSLPVSDTEAAIEKEFDNKNAVTPC